MQTGFTSTSFRNIKNIEKIVKIASDSGAQCIEWGADFHVKDIDSAKRVRALCEEKGIKICSYGSYYRVGSFRKDEWLSVCRIAAATGASSVRVWLGEKDSEKTDEEEYKKLVEDAKEICSVASKFGLTVCPECHDNTFNNNTDAFLRIREDIGCENFRTYFQSRYKKKEYDIDRIARTLPYIETVHISFSELMREQFPKCDFSYIDALIEKLVSAGFDGRILIEYTFLFCYAGIPSCMKKDIKKIKEKLGEKR